MKLLKLFFMRKHYPKIESDLMPINQSINQSIVLLLFLSLFSLFSCTKEDAKNEEPKLDNYSQLIENARTYFESNLLQTSKDSILTKSVTNSLILDWENVHIVPISNISNLEIPILSPITEHCKVTLYNKNGELMSGNKDMTSKLIMIYNATKGTYRHFIVSKIWLEKEKPDLSNSSISDINHCSFTLIHDLEGKLISKYETSGGQIYRLLILDDTVSRNSNHYDIEMGDKSLKIFSYNQGNKVATRYSIGVEVYQSMHELYIDVMNKITNLITNFINRAVQNSLLSITEANTIYGIYIDYIFREVFYSSRHFDPYDRMLRMMYELEMDYGNDAASVFAREVIETWNYNYYWDGLEWYVDTYMPDIIANTIMGLFNTKPSQPGTPGTGSGNPDTGNGGGGSGGENPDNPCPHGKCSGCGKYIETLTRSLSCNNAHDYCKTDGNCKVEVTLTAPISVTLGESYSVSVNVVGPLKPISISYLLTNIDNPQNMGYVNDDNAGSSFNIKSRSPGKYKLMATCSFYGDAADVDSNIIIIDHLYPLRDNLMAMPVVKVGMDASWASTLSAVSASGVQEYGGVVLLDTREPTFGYTYDSQNGDKMSYELWSNDTAPSIDLTWEDKDYGPINGGIHCVMLFHTHPPLSKYHGENTIKRNTGLSKQDFKQIVIPSVVQDYSKTIINSKDSLGSPTKYYNNELLRRKSN